ncbi:MAG: hypothetical protein M3340_06205 [Actinomycetota bacterium]|nr:hypothetical protein [Actinomycetota bacterium]
MKTPAERQEEARRKKLDEIKEQVDDGGLVIRKMTDDERKRFPPKPRPPKRKRW